jgi:hypothetical protein
MSSDTEESKGEETTTNPQSVISIPFYRHDAAAECESKKYL